MLITSGMLWKRCNDGPRQRAGERGLICILQDEKLTNASGLEVFFLIRLCACEFYDFFFFSPFSAGMQSEGI